MTRGAVAKAALALIPPRPTLATLRAAAAKCTACPLYADATQTVFGEGPVPAALMLIGETPGDQEDKLGRPFVGPAGKLLDRCLAKVGIVRDEAYVTNVVKHFKWEPRGKRRLHKKPNALEIAACKPWAGTEIALVEPKVLVLLGATAAQTCSARASMSAESAASRCARILHPMSWRRCIPRHCYVRGTTRLGIGRSRISSPNCAVPPRRSRKPPKINILMTA